MTTTCRSDECPTCYYDEHGSLPEYDELAICCDEQCEDRYEAMLRAEYEETEQELGEPFGVVW